VNRWSYLDSILPDVRRRLAERMSRVPAAELLSPPDLGPRPSFSAALRPPEVSLIAEIKRFSPSRGPIRPDLDAAALAHLYEAGGAAAISVLTEGDHFGGSLADLKEVTGATSLPLLRKDFIIDPYQILEARAFGASAVLLIAAILDDESLSDLAALAVESDLDVLLEVHDEGEMTRALALEDAMIGINNRDLRTFEVSLETSERLASLVPPDRLLVAESGIRDRADVERLAAVGVDAVLVGESLLRREDVEGAVADLARSFRSTPRTAGGVTDREGAR